MLRIATLATRTLPPARYIHGFADNNLLYLQVAELFAMMEQQTRLKKLNIRGNILKAVPADILAKLVFPPQLC